MSSSRPSRIRVYYSDEFHLPLPAGHRFPIDKYRLLRERLQQTAVSELLQFEVPEAATDVQLLHVHTEAYLDKLKQGTLSRVEQKRIGFPWSPEMVSRSRRSTGATLAAGRSALEDGLSVHLAGGTHHAFPDHGQGFCVFNDVAVAIRVLQAEQRVRRVLVIDLDVHQGNGTAAIFAGDASVFTFSMHGARNFPFSKCNGQLDIALPDGTTDAAYLDALQTALDSQLPFAEAELVFYLAGADPYHGDRFGKLKLTKAGLAERDRRVFHACRQHAVPVTVVMSGGYAEPIQDVVDIHATTVELLLEAARPS